jgi:hypothetical protein
MGTKFVVFSKSAILGAGASESGRQNTVFLKSQFFGGGG